MTSTDPMSLPLPTYAGGTKANTTTPVVGTPRREQPPPPEWWADALIPLEDFEALVAVPAMPWADHAPETFAESGSVARAIKQRGDGHVLLRPGVRGPGRASPARLLKVAFR